MPKFDDTTSGVAMIFGPPANNLFGALTKGLWRLLLPGWLLAGPFNPAGPMRSRGLQGPCYATGYNLEHDEMKFSKTTSHVFPAVSKQGYNISLPSNAKETKLVIGWKLSLGRSNPKTSVLLGKWHHAFFENGLYISWRESEKNCFMPLYEPHVSTSLFRL